MVDVSAKPVTERTAVAEGAVVMSRETLDLIRSGNLAASITFAGAILGIAIPLAFAMSASLGLLDLLVWGTVTVVLQAIAYLVTDFVMKDIRTRIEANEVAPAIVMMAVKLAVGAVVAAAVAG